MILSDKKDKILSSLGWVEKGGLWLLDLGTSATPSIIPLSEAKFLSLHPGKNDYFSIVHNYDGKYLRITIHNFEAPGAILAEIAFNDSGITVLGDVRLFRHVKCCYAPYFAYRNESDYHLILIDPLTAAVEVQELSWYNDENYDRGYQGIVGVSEFPNQRNLVFSVQRSSKLVLYNPTTKEATGAIQLAQRHGNPQVRFQNGTLIAIDYDTLLEINLESLKSANSMILQKERTGHAEICRGHVLTWGSKVLFRPKTL